MTSSPQEMREDGPRLRRALTLWDLVFYGIVIQPVAPMGI
jgi:hypothetical protein